MQSHPETAADLDTFLDALLAADHLEVMLAPPRLPREERDTLIPVAVAA